MALQSERNEPEIGDKPLSGRRIVITRPRSQALAFTREIEKLGGQVVEFSTIAIVPPESYEPLDRAIQDIESYHWLIFTSANGVKFFFERFKALNRDISALKRIRIAAIGPQTARELEAMSLRADLVPEEYRAEGILQGLRPEEIRGRRVLLPRAAEAREVLPETLREWGAALDVIEAYRTVGGGGDTAALRSLLVEKEIDMVTFTSSSTVRHFAALFDGENLVELLARTAVGCIGPVTQSTAEELGIRVDLVSRDYTIQGLTRAIVEYFKSKEQGAGSKEDSA
ncbi:MAG: uroporphyrinogen-III synthase [Deltaproteobacteria bacterium]|nr:uroporphyrinogen-III synthase [Deltaproteobacteria bacterium]